MTGNNYQALLDKLDRFIRKYYINQLIRGGIYCLSLWIIFFLVVNMVEYFARLDTVLRTALFYLYLAANAYVLWHYVLVSLFRLFRIGKRIDHEQASRIIGKHFPEVSDKLLNALQLNKMSGSMGQNLELLQAGIDQKASELKPVPFSTAIDLKKNVKYSRYLIFPALILLVLFLSAPSFITEPSERLIRHNRHFEKPAPFTFVIMNDSLEAIQHEDFRLSVQVEGAELPADVFIESGRGRVKLRKESNTRFHYDFLNVQKNIDFNLAASGIYSGPHTLEVLPKPVILDFEVTLDYPAYTRKEDETVYNNGDVIVPEGTEVGWEFYTSNTERIRFLLGKDWKVLERDASANSFSFSDVFHESSFYSVVSENEFVTNNDSLLYQVTVLPDLYPTIMVDEYRDSTLNTLLFFKGVIRDDYGFDRLEFCHKVMTGSEIEKEAGKETIDINPSLNPQQYNHFIDITAFELQPGDLMEYYFQVWDNDRVNGSKSSRTETMVYRAPTLKEIEEQTESANRDLKDQMEEGIREAKELQKEIEDLNKKLIDKPELTWEDKKQIEELLEKEQQLKKKLESIKEETKTKSDREEQFKEVNPEILEKQKQLEELMEELLEDEELRKLFEELQKLLEEVDKNDVNDMLDKMKMSSEELEEMLDRNLELFKQLEFEQKLDETIGKLEKLADKQEKLSEETRDSKKKDSDELKDQQDQLNKEFDELRDEMKELEDLNKELESPNDFDPMEEQQETISEDMQESSEMLEQNSNSKASQSQKSAADKMNEMAQKMSQMQQEMVQEGMMEDMNQLRDLLENLIQVSFDQEALIEEVNSVNVNDPRYTGLMKKQKSLRDDFKMIEDSLEALSKRNIMIEPYISKEVNKINSNMESSVDFLNQRRTANAAARQQYAMTSMNNLALMLSETLEQMQMSMQSMMKSGQSSCKSNCSKPGSGSSIKSIRQLQQQLGQQIEQLKEGMKKEGKKPGDKPGQNSQGMSEKLARMAAEQEALRNRLNDVADQLEKDGELKESSELKRIMEEMERTETDLVNKMITQETLMRQKKIMTRLLRSENAEMEREKEEKRESREAKNELRSNPDGFFEYKRLQNNEVELLKTVPPRLKPFYREKVNQYFYHFED